MQPTSSSSGPAARRLGRLSSDGRTRRERLVERARSMQRRLPPRSLRTKAA